MAYGCQKFCALCVKEFVQLRNVDYNRKVRNL